jgi:heterodisulfide reductase subunit A
MEKLAIRPERLQLQWISAAEGIRFAQLMEEMEKLRLQVTPEEIAETMRLLTEKG